MAKMLEYLGEYFLGTETRKLYREERKWYWEFATDSKDLQKLLRLSKIEEKADLVVGKLIPNIIDIGAIICSLITKSPPYGLILGEGFRLACMGGHLIMLKKEQ